MAEILFSFDVCLCVCVSLHSGPVSQTSLKWLKLQILQACSQGRSGRDPLKFSQKRLGHGQVTPKILGIKC